VSEDTLLATLRARFGLDSFRPGQADIIRASSAVAIRSP
jgi:superfamily II DNA helicase RecQ